MKLSIPKFWAAKPKAEPQQEAIPLIFLGDKDMLKFLSILKAIDTGLQDELNVIPVTNKVGTVLAIALVADHEVETFLAAFQALRSTPATPATPTT